MSDRVSRAMSTPLLSLSAAVLLTLLVMSWGCTKTPDSGSEAVSGAVAIGAAPTWTRVGTTWVHGIAAADLREGDAATPVDERVRALLVEARSAAAATTNEAGLGEARELGFTAARVQEESVGELTARALSFASAATSVVVRPLRGAAPQRPRTRVLLVLDTLRADVAEQEMTRLLERFPPAQRFGEAHAPATWTLPSMAAVQLGEVPSRLRAPDGALIALPDGARTIAAEMRDLGFATAAVVANPTLGHENGFSQGFDVYDVPRYVGQGEWTLPDASEVAAKALELLEWFDGEDLFLYLHFMDAHDPYRDHETGEQYGAPTSGTEVSAEHLETLRAAYRSEVRHLDREITALLAAVEQRRSIDLLVLTADHGEEFHDHGGFGHGPTVYREVARVPLWSSGPLIQTEELGALTQTPFSLLELRRLLLEPTQLVANPASQHADGAVTVETFVHGPPRFAWLDADAGSDAAHWFASARWLGQAPPPETEIEEWLRQRDEGLRSIPDAAANQTRPLDQTWTPLDHPVAWTELPESAWLRLAQQLGAAAPGQWTFARGPAVAEVREALEAPVRNSLSHSPRRAWCWGNCSRASSATTDGDGESPVALLFEADGETPETSETSETSGTSPQTGEDAGVRTRAPAPFAHAPSAQRWVLQSPPERLPPSGAVSWREPERDATFAAGVEETMERLRKLGYVTN